MLTAIITFFLLGLGGLVTSHEAGMSVPDWPTSYGYNMFALPIKFWHGGAFFEHTHRLLASAAGLLTTILAVWLWLKEPRQWMQWLGVIAFLLVVAQGVLGGLRVTLKMDDLGIVHGVVGQSFFILLCAIALFTSRFWAKWSADENKVLVARGLRSAGAGRHRLDFLPAHPRRDDAWTARGPGHFRFSACLRENLAGHESSSHRALQRRPHGCCRGKSDYRLPNHFADGAPHRCAGLFALVAASAWQAWRRLGGNIRWRSSQSSGSR